MPSSSSEGGFEEIRLNPVEDCFPDPPAGFRPFDVECIPIQDFNPGDILPGGRVVLVTPYVKGIQVCSGQYAQFQVLQGFGGQIDRALYLGESVGRVTDSIYNHEVEVPVDCDDVMEGPTEEDGGSDGDRGLAIRDRGRWYVVKLAQGVGGGGVNQVEVYGGNKNPYDGDTMDSYKVAPYRPFIFPRFKEVGLLAEHDLTDEWYDLDVLPDDFEWGDEFTADDDHALPFGLGWARLARGVSIDQYSWDAADYDQHLTSDDDPDNSPSFTVTFVSPDIANDQIIVCFSEAVPDFIGTPDPDAISLTTTGETELNITGVTMTSRPGDNTFIVELDRDVDYDNEVLTISIPGDYVKDGDDNGNTGGGGTVLYKQERFSFIPVVNLSDHVLLRGQVAFINGETRNYTIDDVTRSWYEMYVDGERPKFSMKVLGGNALDNAITSFPNAIKQLAIETNPADWQSFNPSSLPADSSSISELEASDIPEVIDGYGFTLGEPEDALFGEASTWEGRLEIVRNRFVGSFVSKDDVVLMINIRMVADDKETQEYRAVWDIFA